MKCYYFLFGGSWDSIAERCRASYHSYIQSPIKNERIGFRLIKKRKL